MKKPRKSRSIASVEKAIPPRRFLTTDITHHARNNLGETRIGMTPAVAPQKSTKTKKEPV